MKGEIDMDVIKFMSVKKETYNLLEAMLRKDP
jgi:hypothetical protein